MMQMKEKLKEIELNKYNIISFATHGLVAGEFANHNEPGLVLTPPEKASYKDDGLLTASEINQLDLSNTEIVILSACNTATSNNLDGLNGLASSFFYAGVKSILVTYWYVETNSAVKITTGLFEEMFKNPHLSRSEALQKTIIKMINDPKSSHPALWSPFIFIGEGSKGL